MTDGRRLAAILAACGWYLPVCRVLASVAAFGVLGCEPAAYKAPQLPEHQLTVVEVESRAKVLSIDGRPPAEPGEPAPEWFWVSSSECHEVVLYYKETYVRNGGGVYVAFFDPAAFVASVAGSAATQATKLRFYETDMRSGSFCLRKPA